MTISNEGSERRRAPARRTHCRPSRSRCARPTAMHARPCMAPSRRQCRAAGDGHQLRDVGALRLLRFAAWLFAQGRDVLVYDYRGIGGSRPARLAKLRANWLDWGRLDCEAALRYARDAFPGQPIDVVAHSIGGFALGNRRIERPRAACGDGRRAVCVLARLPAGRTAAHVVEVARRDAGARGRVRLRAREAARLDGRYAARRRGVVGALAGALRGRAIRAARSPNPPRAAPRCPPVSRDCRRRCSRLASTTTGSARSRRSSGWSATTRAATSRICGSRRPTSASTRSAISRFSTAASPKHCGRSRSTGCNTARCQPMRRATCMRFIRHRAGVARQRRAGRAANGR